MDVRILSKEIFEKSDVIKKVLLAQVKESFDIFYKFADILVLSNELLSNTDLMNKKSYPIFSNYSESVLLYRHYNNISYINPILAYDAKLLMAY